MGCEHKHPKGLRDLTPLEGKSISLNTVYGFITKFYIQHSQQTGPIYRKYFAGHITVFPNDVESLATTILSHPLVSILGQMYVIWICFERLTLMEVSKLLTIYPSVPQKALQ
jgi:hypothetical protein